MAWTRGASSFSERASHDEWIVSTVEVDLLAYRAKQKIQAGAAGSANEASPRSAERQRPRREEGRIRNVTTVRQTALGQASLAVTQGMTMTKNKNSQKLEQTIDTKCEQLKKLLADQRHKDMIGRYEVGTIVLEIKRTPGSKKYGTKRVKTIAIESGVNASVLYDASDVAAAWSKSEFEKRAKEKNANGIPLTFNHWVEIAHEAADRRSTLIAAVIAESLTVREVKQLVAKTKNKEKRKATVPRALVRGIGDKLERTVSTLLQWTSQLSALEDVSDASVEWIEQAIRQADRLRQACLECENALVAARQRVTSANRGNVPTIAAA